MTRKLLVVAAVIVLVVTASVGAYRTWYQPSQQPILLGAKPIPSNNQHMIPMAPLADVDVPDAARTTAVDTLRGAAQSLEPGSRIDEEQMFSHPGGWFPLSKLTGEYFDEFGMREQTDSEMQFDGKSVQYLIWGSGWPRSVFDGRKVIAVRYYEPLTPDYPETVLGFFVMSPR